jgi:phosphatidylserine/phosphatidylglycerophosphate/cardiolipin synthase-like enzyme
MIAAVLGLEGPAWSASPVRISGVHFDGVLLGTPEPDSAIRIVNTDGRRAVDISGLELSERATGRSDVGRSVRLPHGASIPAGGELWIASSAAGFRAVFGERPAFETADTDPSVPKASAPDGFLLLAAEHGTVALVDKGEVVDFVAYEAGLVPFFSDGSFRGLPWRGEAVRLKKTSAFGWQGQVLARDRDEAGRPLRDTDTAADWDSGFSRKTLGDEPTHRVEIAGQSRFVARPLKRVRARVLATSAPDNNYAALVDAIGSAKHELRVRIYEMTNPAIVDEIIKARRRGVQVWIFLEGSPVGGIADQERWLLDRAARAGCDVHFMATPKGSRHQPRYRFDHSKYVIVDDRTAIIGSENYGRTGVPVLPSYGNRGWMVHVENQAFVAQLREVWDHDHRTSMADVLSIDASTSDAYGLPYRDAAFVPDERLHSGTYAKPAAPRLADEAMDLELVLSPDTSLNEGSALIGMMARAKKTLYVEQNSIRRRWGKKAASSDPDGEARDDAENAPNLALQAVVAAARRGVQVRVLLDSTWYNVQSDEDRDNDDTVAWLTAIALTERLDMSAKLINLQTTHLEKVHVKGVVIDDAEVFVGSINWTENSFKGNREVGVVVGNKKIAGYYASLFRRDWAHSRMYSADVIARADVREALHADSTVLRRLARDDRVSVVAEHGLTEGGRPAAAEIALEGTATGFVDPNTLGAPQVAPAEALYVVGRDAVVVGHVAAVNVSARRTQLRLDDADRPPFTAVIFKSNERRFIDAGLAPKTAFQGRSVRIRGKVTQYQGPEVILSSPDQIEVLR